MSHNHASISRREFLKLAALGAGSAALAGCKRGVQLTAVPAPAAVYRTAVPLPPGTPADLLLVNGRVVSMDAANTVHQAVAIAGDKILQTGADDTIKALAAPQAQVIDLRGRTVTPGFVDAHNHLIAKGLTGTAYIDINPPAVATVEQMQAKIAEGCARVGPGRWVVAQGFISYAGQYPDKTTLDPVSPDNPVMLVNQGGHMGAVNSYALKLADVDADTPDPKFGKLVRDKQGQPTGGLVNHAALDIFRRIWYAEVLTPEIRRQAVLSPQPDFAAYGVTTFADNNVRGMEAAQAYFDAGREQAMTLRAYLMNTIEYYAELEGRTDEIDAIRYEDEMLRFGGYKFLLDGALVAAYTHKPHEGVAWNLSTWEPRALNDAVSTLSALGYQCSFHVVGDAAVDMALDAIEFALNVQPRSDHRHRLEHAVLNTEDALQRTRDLGVVVSTQPHGIRIFGDYIVEAWGEQRARQIMPTRTWLDLGVPLSISSDSPTMPWWQPQPIIAAAVNRLTGSNAVLGPDQCLTIDEAMRAYTMGGAYAIFDEQRVGSLEPGKLADLLVWRTDPYLATLQEMMAAAPIELTLIGGKTVFQTA